MSIKEIAKKIKDLRLESGLSQEDVMFRLRQEGVKMSRPTYYRIESGATEVAAHEIVALGKVFGVKPEFFLS